MNKLSLVRAGACCFARYGDIEVRVVRGGEGYRPKAVALVYIDARY